MNLDKKFIGLDSEQVELNSIYSKFIQVQNVSYNMVRVTEGHYMLGRAFALVDPNNKIVKSLLDKKTLVEIPVVVVSNKRLKLENEKLESRRAKEKQEADRENKKIKSLSDLFATDEQNIRQNT